MTFAVDLLNGYINDGVHNGTTGVEWSIYPCQDSYQNDGSPINIASPPTGPISGFTHTTPQAALDYFLLNPLTVWQTGDVFAAFPFYTVEGVQYDSAEITNCTQIVEDTSLVNNIIPNVVNNQGTIVPNSPQPLMLNAYSIYGYPFATGIQGYSLNYTVSLFHYTYTLYTTRFPSGVAQDLYIISSPVHVAQQSGSRFVLDLGIGDRSIGDLACRHNQRGDEGTGNRCDISG